MKTVVLNDYTSRSDHARMSLKISEQSSARKKRKCSGTIQFWVPDAMHLSHLSVDLSVIFLAGRSLKQVLSVGTGFDTMNLTILHSLCKFLEGMTDYGSYS
jgi:hypothetical protein